MDGRSPCHHVKYIGVILDKRITWRLHVEIIEAKTLRTFVRIYSILKSERLSANIKLNFHEALIRSVMTYACPAWELAADTHPLKLQRLQNKVHRITGNFPMCTPVRNVHTAFNLAHVYDLYNKIVHATSRSHTNHENERVRGIEQGEARHRKYKRLSAGGGQA
jgi:hypothetical protein